MNTHGFVGWNKSPLVWTSNGRLIGDETAFIENLKARYGISDSKSARQLMEIAKENLEIANRKREEATLGRFVVSPYPDHLLLAAPTSLVLASLVGLAGLASFVSLPCCPRCLALLPSPCFVEVLVKVSWRHGRRWQQ